MSSFSEIARQWLEHAQNAVRPHGWSKQGSVYTLTAIRDETHSITPSVAGQGHACWLVVNTLWRKCRVNLAISEHEQRVRWNDPSITSANEFNGIGMELSLPRSTPDGGRYSEIEVSRCFAVASTGETAIRTSYTGGSGQIAVSAFRAVYEASGTDARDKTRIGGMTVEKKRNHDWLGAIAKLAEALPGGKLILGPLIKLRDDDRSAQHRQEFNEKLDALFEKQQAITEEALADIKVLKETMGKSELGTRAVVAFVNELGRRDSERAGEFLKTGSAGALTEPGTMLTHALPHSSFPLVLVTPGDLKRELSILFPTSKDLAELKQALEFNNYPAPDVAERDEFVSRFVNSMTGKSRRMLEATFREISRTRPDSVILQFAAESLK